MPQSVAFLGGGSAPGAQRDTGSFQMGLVVGNCGPTDKGSRFRGTQSEPVIDIISLNACKNLED